MNFPQDTDAKVFSDQWGTGYVETWSGYSQNYSEDFIECIKSHASLDKICLEIGPGGGYWTKILGKLFKKVYALDVANISLDLPNTEFRCVPNRDFNCTTIQDNSIDFVWSFGCFCHLSYDANKQYFRSINRVLKVGGCGIITLANWDRFDIWKNRNPREKAKKFINLNENPIGGAWFYNDLEMAKDSVEQAGLTFKELMPHFRDTVAYIEKNQ